MDVYLMRHGIAQDASAPGREADAARPLSPEGRRKTRAVARGLRRLGVSPVLIGTSPLQRARQTAEIVAAELGVKRIVVCEALRPGGSLKDLLRWLRSQTAPAVLLVGHEPDLSAHTSRLLTGYGEIRIAFKKAGVAALRFEASPHAGAGRLLWLLPPRVLRSLRQNRFAEDED